jgi:hypothetical protein
MVAHAAQYDGALAQVTRVFSGNEEECSREEQRMYHAKRGCFQATIISCLPMKDEAKVTKDAAKKHRCGQKDDECLSTVTMRSILIIRLLIN